MPAGELFINGHDAYEKWGISMTDTALSSLMTPPAPKDYITASVRMEHGVRAVWQNVYFDSRDLTLEFHLKASSEEEFYTRYAAFCEELATGRLVFKTKYQPEVLYKTLYVSCSQFTQYDRRLAKFSLKVRENDPTDRQ